MSKSRIHRGSEQATRWTVAWWISRGLSGLVVLWAVGCFSSQVERHRWPTPLPTPTDTPEPTPTFTRRAIATRQRSTATPGPTATETPEARFERPAKVGGQDSNPRILEANSRNDRFVLRGTLPPGGEETVYIQIRAQLVGDLEVAVKPSAVTVTGVGTTLVHTGSKEFSNLKGLERYAHEKLKSGTVLGIRLTNEGSAAVSYECYVMLYQR